MDYDPYVCVLCEKKMGATTIPYWIIDPDSLEVTGLAHKGCRDKMDYQTVAWRLTISVDIWIPGGQVSAPPSRELIEFAAKMIRYRLSLPDWGNDIDFKVLMMAGREYLATNIEEFLGLPSTKEYFDWWCNPKQSSPMTQEEVKEVKKRLRENLGGS